MATRSDKTAALLIAEKMPKPASKGGKGGGSAPSDDYGPGLDAAVDDLFAAITANRRSQARYALEDFVRIVVADCKKDKKKASEEDEE